MKRSTPKRRRWWLSPRVPLVILLVGALLDFVAGNTDAVVVQLTGGLVLAGVMSALEGQ